jgi:23S rRNA pseudouridine2457 synthase
MARILLFNKPFGVLSQFTDREGRPTLADYIHDPQVQVAGRLDFDSEGLLLLTDCGAWQARISHPRFKLPKTYLAQVEGCAADSDLAPLRRGIALNDGPTLPATCRVTEPPADLWPRHPPIRERRAIPTSWIEITLREGRNRQVRRMTAAIGLPTLRLIRTAIGEWRISDTPPGHSRWLDPAALDNLFPPSRPRQGRRHVAK